MARRERELPVGKLAQLAGFRYVAGHPQAGGDRRRLLAGEVSPTPLEQPREAAADLELLRVSLRRHQLTPAQVGPASIRVESDHQNGWWWSGPVGIELMRSRVA